MISKFVKEQKNYTKNELYKLLKYSNDCKEEQILSIIGKLKQSGILEIIKTKDSEKDINEIPEEDIELDNITSENEDIVYRFKFVGIIVVSKCILKCYPKYITKTDKPLNELKQVLKVIEKYNAKRQQIKIFDNIGEGYYSNRLPLFLFLLEDYFENGIYNNQKNIIEDNGDGEIFWDKTINNTFAIINSNIPYYVNIQTKKRIHNEYDYFKRLHECIITQISEELRETHLLELFDITGEYLSDESLSDFGEIDYILYKIKKELNIQFNTRKQLLLNAFYLYFSNKCTITDENGISLFGTKNFNLIWEDVCSDILDNQLYSPLQQVSLPTVIDEDYLKKYSGKNTRLIDIIEKPFWSYTQKEAKDTLIPDIISIIKKDMQYLFMIFDAKYYHPVLEKNKTPMRQPGIESITKQYLYQLAYKEFLHKQNFEFVKNCFLIPTEEDTVINKETVQMNMFKELGLENINVRLFPAQKAFDLYLSNKKIKDVLQVLDL